MGKLPLYLHSICKECKTSIVYDGAGNIHSALVNYGPDKTTMKACSECIAKLSVKKEPAQ